MISPKSFHRLLADQGVNFFTGVPDSLLKEFCAYLDAALEPQAHVIAVNEGTAIALAAGHHLATGQLPLVYMQNSGLGNAINPLLSLADREVSSIPMILLIGWRGAPDVADEPQHVKQGRVTPALLKVMEFDYRILSGDPDLAQEAILWAAQTAILNQSPVALLVHKGAFGPTEQKRAIEPSPPELLTRQEAIEMILPHLPANAPLVSTTGMISRALYQNRIETGAETKADFLTVGAMGHASQIALGIARAKPSAQVVCLDGDGAALMHMGGLAAIGSSERGRILHILLNNGAHESVGGQPTAAQKISLSQIAQACGYDRVIGPVQSREEIIAALQEAARSPQRTFFLEITIALGSSADLMRPKEKPLIAKQHFMRSLRDQGP